MCGIIGQITRLDDTIIENFRNRRESLSHRGPNDAGEWIDRVAGVVMGHRRLSIIDTTEASNQPFISEDGQIVLVFNGEIYNYVELREELIAAGYRFQTSGDTEVLIRAYEHWGKDCLQRLNGMWAFALWDRRNGEGEEHLFLARDRAGKKPLYYQHQGQAFAFASEMKGISHSGQWNLDALNYYLACGFVPYDQCLADGVHKLPAGHAAIYKANCNQLKIWRYWQLPSLESDHARAEGALLAEQVWELLKDSVRIRLRSDVPTGIFLSGGLDSSLITAAAATVSNTQIKTFTIALPGSDLDESPHARLIAEAFNTDHHVLELPKPSLDVLQALAPFIDEPIADSSILPMFMVSRLTAQHVTVALGGDGGDELYGGYRHYQAALKDRDRFKAVPLPLLHVAAGVAARLPAGIHGRNRIAALRAGANESTVWGTPYFDLELRQRLLHRDVVDELGDKMMLPELDQRSLLNLHADPVDAMTRADFSRMLPDDFLFKVDRASMANSLEVRSPWLDVRLIEHAYSRIPSHWKATRRERRRVQNLMAHRYLPKKFVLNRKQGFSVPMDAWMKGSDMEVYLGGLPRNLFNHKMIESLVAGQKKGRTNGARLFGLIMLALSR